MTTYLYHHNGLVYWSIISHMLFCRLSKRPFIGIFPCIKVQSIIFSIFFIILLGCGKERVVTPGVITLQRQDSEPHLSGSPESRKNIRERIESGELKAATVEKNFDFSTAFSGAFSHTQDPYAFGPVALLNELTSQILGFTSLEGNDSNLRAGAVLIPLGNSSDVGRAIVLQTDGLMVVGCESGNIARYNTNGTLDTSFNINGTAENFPGVARTVYALSLQGDAKIVAVGGISNDFLVVRYNTNGTLDTSFNTSGKVLTSISGIDTAYGVILQPDGKIVAAGGTSDVVRIGLARYNTDGTLDTSFNTNGKVITNGGGGGVVYRVILQTDGKIVAAGKVSISDSDFALARYNTDGALDTAFNTSGVVLTSISGIDSAYGVSLQTDGKIVAAGIVNGNFGLGRYSTDGALDTSFDTDGVVLTDISGSLVRDINFQVDGKIVAAGRANSLDFGVARYNTNGTLDTSFNTNGTVITNISGSDFGYGSTLQTNGKIVVTGSTSGATNLGLARYNTNGALDTSFNINGTVITTALGAANSFLRGLTLQLNGKIVGVGSSTVNDDTDFAVTRLNANGTLDTSFDTDGKAFTSISGSDLAYSVILQTDGKIVAAGAISNGVLPNFGLARYNTNGALDTSFDADGKVITDISGQDIAYSVILQTDGKIVAAGATSNSANFGLARYNTNGALDTSFDTDGTVITDISGNDIAYSVILQTDGKIVAAGATSNSANFGLARYNTDGALDTSFDTDGKVITDISATEGGYGVIVQTDGKIVVVGTTTNNANLGMARYNTNGTLDTSFNGSGKVNTDISGTDIAYSAQILKSGKILLGGTANSSYALARYNTNGTIDTSFQTSGKTLFTTGGGDAFYGIIIQTDGRIIGGGSSVINGTTQWSLIRLWP